MEPPQAHSQKIFGVKNTQKTSISLLKDKTQHANKLEPLIAP
jgi:hypothetical protein